MTTAIAKETASLFKVSSGDIWETEAPGLINKIMTALDTEGMNGQGELTDYEGWFSKEFIEVVAEYGQLLDLPLPPSGYAYLALEGEGHLIGQDGFRGWNEQVISDFNAGFMKDVIPKLREAVNG